MILRRAAPVVAARVAAVTLVAALVVGLAAPGAARPDGAARPAQAGPSPTPSEEGDGAGAPVLGVADLPDPVLDLLPVVPTSTTERAAERLVERRSAEEQAAADWLTSERDRIAAGNAEITAIWAVFDDRARLDQAESAVVRQRGVWEAAQAITDDRFDALSAERRQLRVVARAVFTSEPSDAFGALGSFDQMSASTQRDAFRARMVEVQVGVVDRRAASWRRAKAESDAEARQLEKDRKTRQARAETLQDTVEELERTTAVRAATDRTAEERERAAADATRRRQEARDDHRKARLLAVVPFTDMPLVAVDAYWRASALAPCSLPWWVLAGVGKVESHHGTAHGSRLTELGDTTVRIIGIPLDGRPGTATITDSDGGALDGDGAFDRAVGPMQFIPGTWRTLGVDGNGDAKVDPHNLYDAASAAARLLCLGRGDLTTDAQYRNALLSYNNSIPYANQVLGLARRYQSLVGLPDLPPEPDLSTAGAAQPGPP